MSPESIFFQVWFRPKIGTRSKAYIFSSESISISTISLTEWLGPPSDRPAEMSVFDNCVGILLETWQGVCMTYPQGLSYASCACGPRLLTEQVYHTKRFMLLQFFIGLP
jgi:hypothetical protein